MVDQPARLIVLIADRLLPVLSGHCQVVEKPVTVVQFLVVPDRHL